MSAFTSQAFVICLEPDRLGLGFPSFSVDFDSPTSFFPLLLKQTIIQCRDHPFDPLLKFVLFFCFALALQVPFLPFYLNLLSFCCHSKSRSPDHLIYKGGRVSVHVSVCSLYTATIMIRCGPNLVRWLRDPRRRSLG